MRVTSRPGIRAAALRATAIATAAVVVSALLVPHSPPADAGPTTGGDAPPAAGANPATTTNTGTLSTATTDPVTAGTAADDLTGDIVFSVPSGTFQQELSVSLATTVSGAQIRYTTDGTLPTAASTLYTGTPLRLTRTTQVRAQAFVGQTPTGAPGTAVYAATATTTRHDLPLVLIDSYGAGRPGRQYFDSATMIFQPGSDGTTSLTAAPAVATRAGFRLRGQSSSTFDKTPYRLEFWDNDDDDADYPVLGMPADSDWVLRGPFPDKSLIREALVYDLGRELGLHTPRYAFVEFYLNTDGQPVGDDDYMGMYMIVETIKNSKNRLDLKQLDPDDVTLPKITGGYIWKFEWMAAEEPTLPCSGPPATCWNFLEVDDPSPLQPEQRDWLRDHIQQFHDVLRAPNFADPDTGYRAYIDVDSFVDHLIISELSRDMDAYYRSAYFHKDRDSKIIAGPLWDFDLTFGVGGFFGNDQIAGWQYQQPRNPVAFDWFTQLLRDPAFVDQVRQRWQSLRRGLLSDTALRARIDALAAPLTNGAQRNFQRWPNLTTPMIGFFFTPTAPTWQGQVEFLRDWLLRRAAWLDSTDGWGTPDTTPSPTPTTTPPPGDAGCTATYAVTNQWTGGFQGQVRITAGSAPIRGWTVTWTYGGGQTITQAWDATVTSQGTTVTARNLDYNGTLAAGASTTFGFLGTGTPGTPVLTCTPS